MGKATTLLVPIFGLGLCYSPLAAQSESAVSTTLGATARYEIVQSELLARSTFKLDRICGNVQQLVENSDNQLRWQSMYIERQPTCPADGRARYQLYMSGMLARATFLMNTDTGMTWRLVESSDKILSWQLMS